MTVLTPTENDKSLIKKMHRALGRSSAAGSGTCFTLTGAHQLLLEEARTAYADIMGVLGLYTIYEGIIGKFSFWSMIGGLLWVYGSQAAPGWADVMSGKSGSGKKT